MIFLNGHTVYIRHAHTLFYTVQSISVVSEFTLVALIDASRDIPTVGRYFINTSSWAAAAAAVLSVCEPA